MICNWCQLPDEVCELQLFVGESCGNEIYEIISL